MFIFKLNSNAINLIFLKNIKLTKTILTKIIQKTAVSHISQ